jgi:MFS family permease
VAEGLRLVVATPQLRTVLVVWNVVIVANAGINVGEIAFAKDDLGGGDFGFALIVAATGLGLAVGSFLTPLVLSSIGLKRVYAGSIAVMAIGYGLATLSPTVWVAAPLAAFATLGNGAAIVCNQLLIQRGAPDAMRGRAIAVLMSSTYLTLAVSMGAAGLVVNELGGRASWLLAAAVYAVGALVAVAMTRRLKAPRASHEETAAADAASVGDGPLPTLVGAEDAA